MKNEKITLKALNKKIKIGSICCGMGGFDEGLRQIGFKTVWAIDIMKEATESFKANHPYTKVYCQDAHLIEDFTKLSDERIQGLVFGPPCQGMSLGNDHRRMNDPRNFVYLATLRALEQTNAEFFIFENVEGILSLNNENGISAFEIIKKDYEQCGKGYNVAYQLIECSEVGVPQLNRKRLIMVGFRKDLNKTYIFPELTHGKGKKPLVTLKDTIWHLRNVDQTGDYYDGPYDDRLLARNRQKSWDSPFYTVVASVKNLGIHPDGGKMTYISKNKWHIPDTCRRISVLEAKLLQTFPENYIVTGSLFKKYEQIGNAVPPKLAEFIGMPIVHYYEERLANYYNHSEKQLSLFTDNKLQIPNHYDAEYVWLNMMLKKYPDNSFYKSLLNWIMSGKKLTPKQKSFIKA